MKRETLQNIKVGEQPLPKEIIDMIMDENGRDIENAKAPFADYETIKEQLGEAQKAIKGFQEQGKDIETVRTTAAEWEKKYNQAIADHKKAMADRDFSDRLNGAITAAHGKNSKAIAALLDVDTLRESKNQEADIKAAIENCQKENDYLFGDTQTPPPFAGGTGTHGGNEHMDGVEAAFMGLNPGLKI